MDNSIYEVSRDEYTGFVDQIKPSARLTETVEEGSRKLMKLYSTETGTHLATRVINEDNGEEQYYIFNMPLDIERRPPRPVQKFTLESKEEVQAFMRILNKWQKENTDGRTLC